MSSDEHPGMIRIPYFTLGIDQLPSLFQYCGFGNDDFIFESRTEIIDGIIDSSIKIMGSGPLAKKAPFQRYSYPVQYQMVQVAVSCYGYTRVTT